MKSSASIGATDMINKYITENKIATDSNYTTYLKENDGNIDLLYIKPIEK
jgi:hypothetical protein